MALTGRRALVMEPPCKQVTYISLKQTRPNMSAMVCNRSRVENISSKEQEKVGNLKSTVMLETHSQPSILNFVLLKAWFKDRGEGVSIKQVKQLVT